ncbi:sulfite exporter TauE/SafE family protein [Thermodesulfobacteriota bacterium]
MIDFSYLQWIISIICVLMIGFAKSGIPGSGGLVPPLMASIMPARESTGFVLPLLIMADILAIIYWRRHVEWTQLMRLMPWAWLGIFLGYLGMGQISDEGLKIFIGLLVLILMAVSWIRDKSFPDDRIPGHWLFAAFLGTMAGVASMMANAAGPVMIIYLAAMGLSKKNFIGTSAWFFWIINLSKLPFSHRLDLISIESLQANLLLLPFIITGGIIGILLVHRISQKVFDIVVKVLAIGAAFYLICS